MISQHPENNGRQRHVVIGAAILGLCLLVGLVAFGYQLGSAAMDVKLSDRHVTVKGLSEREVQADIVIWPIQFTVASNQLGELYESIEQQQKTIRSFLTERNIEDSEISTAPPSITDKSAQQYGGNEPAEFRYTATLSVTVYSQQVDAVRKVMSELSALGRQGIVLAGNEYQTEYIYSGLNGIKPEMIEEATQNAREVGEKFAADSNSRLGKIRQASQGQFSIGDRDKNNPHIKRVRVVSTVEYFLSD